MVAKVSTAEKQAIPVEGAMPLTGDSSHASLRVKRILAEMDRMGLPFIFKSADVKSDSHEALAEALGTVPDELALTTVYRGMGTRKPVLVVHSGITRVSDRVLSQLVGENVQRAEPAFVERYAGFLPEAVPPVGHLNRLPVLMDSGLSRFPRVWCSAGEPGAFVSVPSLVLARVLSARLVRLVN